MGLDKENPKVNPAATPLQDCSDTNNEVVFNDIDHKGLIDRLQFEGLDSQLLDSVLASTWSDIDNGRTLIEVRRASIIRCRTEGEIYITDFDDCIMSATGWHAREYTLIAESPKLRNQGVSIPQTEAKEIYDMAKVHVPGLAEQEKRYTPRLNLILLSMYKAMLKHAAQTGLQPEDIWQEIIRWKASFDDLIQKHGEQVFDYFSVDETIKDIFMTNSPADFLYPDYVTQFLDKGGPNDIRIVATRGKIEGPLGQVYKVHQSGLFQQNQSPHRIDMVVYTNDVKEAALLHLLTILHNPIGQHIMVYDDNPNEVKPYIAFARTHNAPYIEIIQVSHPDAKRREMLPEGMTPTTEYKRGPTKYRHYSFRS